MRAIDGRSRHDPRKVLALVLAGGNGTRLRDLTRNRAKPAVPFGGQHRIVDYALSNCVNSGIRDTAVLTQYKAQSLIRHLQRNWISVSSAHAETIEIWPAQQRNGTSWYAGTADAVHQNRDLIEAVDPDDVLILAGDHVYEMDYRSLVCAHERAGAAVTISCVEVPASQSREFGIVEVDEDLRLKSFAEKPEPADRLGRNDYLLASMGIYLFNTQYLLDCLEEDARDPDSRHDFGFNVLPRIIGDGQVYASLFRSRDGMPGYWRDVGTVDSYWHAHQELLQSKVLQTTTRGWPLHGSERAATPVRLSPTAGVTGSVLGSGSEICGRVDRSVVSTRCRVGDSSIVSESVLLPQARVGRNCRLSRVIVDSGCHVPDNTVIDARYLGDTNAFYVSPNGITLVTDETLAAACAEYEPALMTA